MNFQAFGRVHMGHGVFEILHHIDMPHYGDKHWLKVDICCNILLLISSILFSIPARHPPKKTKIFFLGTGRLQRSTVQTLAIFLYDLHGITTLHVEDQG